MPSFILLLERKPPIAQAVEKALRSIVLDIDLRWVTSQAAFLGELDVRLPDLILADPALSGFGGHEQHRAWRERSPDVPFVLLADRQSESMAIDLVRGGATDCIFTDHVALLPAAVERALRLRVERIEGQRAREELRVAVEALQAISEPTNAFLETGNWDQTCALLLENSLRQTGSDCGFVAVVDGRALVIQAHRGFVWEGDGSERPSQPEADHEPRAILIHTLDNLPGLVVSRGRSILRARLDSEPPEAGRLPAQPDLTSFLGVPLQKGQDVLGVICVANRPAGYTTSDQARLEAVARAASVLFDSHYRFEREADLKEQLRQSQKMEAVGHLAGGVAHDFNNLLTVILGYTQALLDAPETLQDQKTRLGQILRAGERAAGLTHQLLALSRRQVMQLRVVDINAVVAEMGDMLRRLIGEHIQVLTVLDPNLGRVKADRAQLEQVIMNLALNARDAMPSGGTLVIETHNVEIDAVGGFQAELPPPASPPKAGEQGPGTAVPGSISAPARPPVGRASQPTRTGVKHDLLSVSGRYTRVTGKFRRLSTSALTPYVRLGIADTGCGMDNQTVARLFEPFFTTKEVGKGTGLGLATVYGIVKQSGGHIAVESEPGRGTMFKIFLPRLQEAAPAVANEARSPAAVRPTETVLLVEDETQVREFVSASLVGGGYRVLQAANGEEALRIGERHIGSIDLLLADVVMPQMSGHTLAERLVSTRPQMKVLFMSGYTDDILGPHGVLDPDTFLLEKPFTTATLEAKVRQLLDLPPKGVKTE